jgi:hypothetical protein
VADLFAAMIFFRRASAVLTNLRNQRNLRMIRRRALDPLRLFAARSSVPLSALSV